MVHSKSFDAGKISVSQPDFSVCMAAQCARMPTIDAPNRRLAWSATMYEDICANKFLRTMKCPGSSL